MAQLRNNLIANFAGAGWTACLQFASVPLLIHLLGVEAYGLIGFFATLLVTLQVLDLGMSATVNRELARYSAMPRGAEPARDLLRTLEIGYWLLGCGIGAGVALLAPFIAGHWLQSTGLDDTVRLNAVRMMGLVVALQWPISFYQGGLQGLQRQVSLNLIRILAGTLGTGGALLLLWRFSGGVNAYFLWLALVNLLQVLLLAVTLWRKMPSAARPPRADRALATEALRFARGMGGIMVLGVLLTQMDKLVLSWQKSLTEFGYYTVAGVLVGGLQLFITPIFSAIFPRFSSLLARGDEEGVRRLYHASSQLMAVCVVPTAVVLSLCAQSGIGLWTGNADVAAHAAPSAVLLLFGTMLNALMQIPNALQLASGWTRLSLLQALGEFLVFAPFLVWAVGRYGATGAAATWLLVNISYLSVGIVLMHRRLLRGQMVRWLAVDIGVPLVAVLLVVAAAAPFISRTAEGVRALLQIATLGSIALAAAALAAPEIRAWLWAAARTTQRGSLPGP